MAALGAAAGGLVVRPQQHYVALGTAPGADIGVALGAGPAATKAEAGDNEPG